jgi:type II secretory pathway pseudopilin PulG
MTHRRLTVIPKRLAWCSATGFTLAEMAVVILLMGIAMSMGLKMLTANLDNTAYSETKLKQERIKIALIGFLRTNGRLPCPDNAATVATGAEVSPCNAAAANGYGIVPWQTLGIPRDTVQDGWGNYFTYRVANSNILATTPLGAPPLHVNANQNWTIKAGAGAFDIRSFVSTTTVVGYQSLLIQNRDPAPGPNSESRNAVVVILSHGKNGLGAKTTKVGLRIAGAADDELTNATLGSTTFFRRAVTENPAATGGFYDDLVAYMTPQDLLQPLISEGTLKACYAYCTSAPAYSTATCSIPVPGGGSCTNCTAVGAAATVVQGTCTGIVTCGTCTFPATASCPATGIPIGSPIATCL